VSIPADAVNDPNAHVEGVRLSDDKLATLFGSRGIGKNTQVVFYDDNGGFHSARLFWMLEHLGHRKAALLNGGIQEWTADGHRLSLDQPKVQPAPFTPTLNERRSATADWLLDRQHDPEVTLVDVRPPAVRAKGYIPWARSIPWAQNLNADKTMKSA